MSFVFEPSGAAHAAVAALARPITEGAHAALARGVVANGRVRVLIDELAGARSISRCDDAADEERCDELHGMGCVRLDALTIHTLERVRRRPVRLYGETPMQGIDGT